MLKKRWIKNLAVFLAAALFLQSFNTTGVFAEEAVVTEENLPVFEGEPEQTAENPAAEEASPVSDGLEAAEAADPVPTEENTSADEAVEAAASEESIPEERISDNIVQADQTALEPVGASEEKKCVTVMLYQVGSDLERGNLAARKDLTEIMEGIDSRTNKDTFSVNFIVETGGMNGKESMEEYNKRVAGRTGLSYNKLKDAGLDYTKNQRWILSGNEIKEVVDYYAKPTKPDRVMTRKNGDGIIEELLEFINVSTKYYPADQYILILWDHGNGPKDGFGSDERDPEAAIGADDIAATMAATEEFGNRKKTLAWIGYDACLMANIETALAWAPYARYYLGSEETEGNDGWSYQNWVKKLCNEAALSGNDFTNDAEVDRLMSEKDGIAQVIVHDFVESYLQAGTATQSLVSLNSIAAVGNALADFAKEINLIFEKYPVDTYRMLRVIRKDTQGFNGQEPTIMDIKDFVDRVEKDFANNMIAVKESSPSELYDYEKKIKDKGEVLRTALKTAVISENHTDEYANLGGLTAFFPYVSVEEEKNDDLEDYRNIYDGGWFDTAPYDGVIKNLDSYRDMLGLYHSLYNAGATLEKADTTSAQIEEAFSRAVKKYQLEDWNNKEIIKKIPSDLLRRRIQNEAIKIQYNNPKYSMLRSDYYLFDSFDQHLFLDNGNEKDGLLRLGYLPGAVIKDGKQDLYNYATPKWFGLVSKNGVKLPLPLYGADVRSGDNALSGKTDIIIPVVSEEDEQIYLLDIGFENGNNKGKLYGMWPFVYKYGQFGRYISDTASIKDLAPFDLIGDMTESLQKKAGIEFNYEKPLDYAYGVITKDTLEEIIAESGTSAFSRDLSLNDFVSGISIFGYKEILIKDELRDVFDSSYTFGDTYFEKITVSVSLRDDLSGKKKGDYLKSDDLVLNLKNVYQGNVEKEMALNGTIGETLFCLHDDQGNEIPLSSNNTGYLCTVSGAVYTPVSLNEALRIYLKQDSLSINKYKSLDGADTDLASSFRLSWGEGDKGQYVDINVYDTATDTLSIETLNTPLYYLAYKYDGIDNKKAYSSYFKVYLGNLDVTNDGNLNLTFGTKNTSGRFVSGNKSIPSGLKPGAEIAVYAKFSSGRDALTVNNEAAPLRLLKSPAKIKGIATKTSERLGKLNTQYTGPIEVTYTDANNKTVVLKENTYRYTTLNYIAKNNRAVIDVTGIDNSIAADYKNVRLTPDGGYRSEFEDYFNVTEFILEKYTVYPVTRVRYLSSFDNTELIPSVKVPSTKPASKGRVKVSENASAAKGEVPVEWYYKAGRDNPVIVYQDGKAVNYGAGAGVELVEKKNGKWLFYLPEGKNQSEVIFYAGYTAEVENQGEVNALIDPITPVEYTGRNLVTTKSNSSGSKVIGLVVRTADGKTILDENIDYTVSYKNNKNVSDIYDRKPPTLIIKGKGNYKGLKYAVYFSILPVDLVNAEITLDRRFAPITTNKKKGVTLKATVKLPGGATVPANRYELHYFRVSGNGLRTELTTEELASLYKTTEVYPLYVSATATQPADQGSNFQTGTRIDPAKEAFVYACPKSSGKIAVSLKKNKYDYTENGIKLDSIFCAQNLKSLKAGKNTISIDAVEQAEAYYDKALTKPVGSDTLTNAGTYYLDIVLKPANMVKYGIYTSTPLQVTVKGTTLKKSHVALVDKKIKAVSGNERTPRSLDLRLRFASDFEWKSLEVECTRRDGGTATYLIRSDDPAMEEISGMQYYTLKGVDNGAPGTYKVTIIGKEGYTSKVAYSYKVVLDRP